MKRDTRTVWISVDTFESLESSLDPDCRFSDAGLDSLVFYTPDGKKLIVRKEAIAMARDFK